MMYLITEATLNKIVEFARQNPEYNFHTETISDGGLSCIFLDYIGAFSILCLAGIFGNKKMSAIIFGTVAVMLVRFSLHYISGVLIFNSFGELWNGFSTDNTWLYSLLYNGAYMLPETVFTTIGALLLFKTPQMRRLLLPTEN